jgi:NAD(P)-dependent dehydrogenase (short-subunit alcohol dehydrogenase family)
MSERGAVLVTGCSTGIGAATAARLAADGFSVYAGVRRDADAQKIAGPRITPVTLDVTDEASIKAAIDRVAPDLGGAGLAGVVNNAGITVEGPVEALTLDDWRRQMEVNLFGVVAVLYATLPFVRRAKGRVVNIGSIGDRVAFPMVAPYAASKHAVKALTEALRREIEPFGCHVALIEPGSVSTPIWRKGVDRADELLAGFEPARLEPYEEAMRGLLNVAIAQERMGIRPERVAAAISHAMTARRPRTRYLVGRDAKVMARVAAVLPDRAFDALAAREMRRLGSE